jgi:simple sugar transport system substrate-binding protein
MLQHKKLFTMLLIVVAMTAVVAWVTPAPVSTPDQPLVFAPLPVQGDTIHLNLPLAQATAQPAAAMTLGLAVHSDPTSDTFWSVVARGFKDATTTYGITAKVGGNGDPKQQAQLIQTYVAAKVDGIVISMANPDALKDAVQGAVTAGIPVITINSGAAQSKAFGALAHVGQSERVAGQGAGDKFTAAGLKNVLCVVHEEANIGLEDRCAGLKDNFKGTMTEFSVASTGVKDVKGTMTAIQNKLTADKTIDGILTLNPDIAIAARDAIKAAGTSQKLATFDLSPTVIDAIISGDLLFAIDQQQYLQGYLPVVMLYLYKNNLNTVGGGQPVLTGPGFVDKSNAAQVKTLTAKGTR